MSNSSIWVLIVGDSDAAICTSEEGASKFLRTVSQADIQDCGAEKGRRHFALQLMSELFRGAYDGLIIIAAKDMLEELRRIALPEFSKRLVAEISHAPSDLSIFLSGQMPAWGTVQ
jgi:protein required for attachment to host cells